MYILSLESGYVQIELNEKGGYDLIEYKGGTSVSVKIGKRKKTAYAIPIGQIVIDKYNENLRSYLDAGGTVEEALKVHRDRKIKIAQPYPPLWIYPKSKPKESTLTNTDFSELPYMQVCYLQFMGELTPVFSISTLDDLYFYDLFRMKAAEVFVKECADCGRAFLAKTTAVRCEDCRKAGMGEKKKRDNLKSNPTRKLIYKIKDRAKRRDTSADYQNGYFNSLYNALADATDNLTGNALSSRVQQLDTLDSKYWKLYRRINSDNYFDDQQWKQWTEERYSLFTQENPEQWLKNWYEEAGSSY